MKPTRRSLAALIAVGLVGAPMLAMPAAAASTLPQPVQEALLAALADEYHAEAFYAAVIDKYGAVRPFANIIRAEQTHAAWIADLMNTYGVPVPANTMLGSDEIAAAVPATLAGACSVGVTAEIDNAALYDERLLPAVTAYPDITAALERLRDASQNMHLPAFQRCAA